MAFQLVSLKGLAAKDCQEKSSSPSQPFVVCYIPDSYITSKRRDKTLWLILPSTLTRCYDDDTLCMMYFSCMMAIHGLTFTDFQFRNWSQASLSDTEPVFVTRCSKNLKNILKQLQDERDYMMWLQITGISSMKTIVGQLEYLFPPLLIHVL